MSKIPIFVMFNDKPEWTDLCLEYLRKNTDKSQYRLILINNGSIKTNIEKTKDMIEDDDVFIDFDSCVSASHAYNVAIREHLNGCGCFIILHNDCLVTKGWLDCLVRHAEENEDFSVVFPRTNYSTEETAARYDTDIRDRFISIKLPNRQKHGKEDIRKVIEETYLNCGGLDGYCEKIKEMRGSSSVSEEICYFCTMYNADLFNRMGGFDSDFIIPCGDMKLYNYKSILEEHYPVMAMDCFVHHNGNTTTDSFRMNYDSDRRESDELFEKKKDEIKRHQANMVRINTAILDKTVSVLFMRDDGIGDMIMSMFSIMGMKEKYKNIEISYATRRRFMRFISGFDCIDHIVELPDEIKSKDGTGIILGGNRFISLYENEYDIVFDFIKFFEERNKNEYNVHRAEQIASEVKKHPSGFFSDINLICPSYNFGYNNIFINKFFDEDLSYIAVCPDGSCDIRSIPSTVYRKIIQIESKRRKVIVLGKDKVSLDLENINEENVLNLSGETNVEDIPQIISKCEYIYTPDTGFFHIAGILGVPCVAFFGTIDPEKRDGYYPSSSKNRIYFKKEMICTPCWDVGCSHVNCMKYTDEEIERIVAGELLDNG